MEDKKISFRDLEERIDAMGQESETKAAKWVIENESDEQKDRNKFEADQLDVLTEKRKFTKGNYYINLYQYAKKQLSLYDIPRGYNVDIVLKKEGKLIFGLQKNGYRWYAKGMNICGEPKYDINCVDRLIIQTQISLDELVDQHEKGKTVAGIILPK